MRSAQRAGREMIEAAARLLAPLSQQIVFLGGAATALLITDLAAPDVRFTEDVDVIVEIATRTQYYHLEERLREIGFTQPREEQSVICRWAKEGVIVDVMPTATDILTFGNRWYAPAMRSAMKVTLAHDVPILLITAPCFLATKMEAFRGGQRGDLLTSRDVQDVVSVLDGRPEVVAEVRAADQEVRDFLATEFKQLAGDEDFLDVLPGLLDQDAASQARQSFVLTRMSQIASTAA